MWYNGNAMGLFGWTMMVFFWVAVIALIIWAVRNAGTAREVPRSNVLSLLERRFAAGKIERDEFEEKNDCWNGPELPTPIPFSQRSRVRWSREVVSASQVVRGR